MAILAAYKYARMSVRDTFAQYRLGWVESGCTGSGLCDYMRAQSMDTVISNVIWVFRQIVLTLIFMPTHRDDVETERAVVRQLFCICDNEVQQSTPAQIFGCKRKLFPQEVLPLEKHLSV